MSSLKQLFTLILLSILFGCASDKYNHEDMACKGTNVSEFPDTDLIARIIENKNYDLRWCYTSRMRMSSMPEFLTGDMAYLFTLNNQGHVVQSTLETKMPINAQVIQCMKKVLDETQYPCSQINEAVKLKQTVQFSPHDY